MDVCLTWIILGLITLGLLYYLMMKGMDRAMGNFFDDIIKESYREEGAEEGPEEGFSIDTLKSLILRTLSKRVELILVN